MKESAAVAHLVEQIDRNLAIAERIPEEGPWRESLDRLQAWQVARLDETYADLRATDRFRPACDFFLDELYGGREVHARDRQLKRVVPIMRRFLPGHLLFAIGEAMHLQAISLEFDFRLAEHLIDIEEITQPVYAHAYRADGDWEGREEQLRLIRELGDLLVETVRKPMVHRLIRMMRLPAELAGVGLLQDFLQRGLDAFAHMDGDPRFLSTIEERETDALRRLQSGEDWPFEPWIGHWPAREAPDNR
ncbi:hypothetical protein IC757_06770 [Wenzhouxiangella sp. AB-CW3]|uniref:FFLEELY motif protein n=1 Tax=Wenzhouxiangella sp. AB-CW3 TaxID=2771012 RepID=UPI00168B91EA|nr:hypothetical protein [Wenzhouxiangella sp. AB-CW3]QOC23821.1 hypothetical protein IC757_06770 [Wenzhouxiangella sp. AB-CW3]